MKLQRFKIPTSLDASFLDMEFTFRSKDGLATRPISAKTILIWLFSGLGLMYLLTGSFITSGGVVLSIIFSVVWLWLTFVLARTDKTKRLGLELLIPAINYTIKSNRHVSTRLVDGVKHMRDITGLDTVDEEDGMLHFVDGELGHVYAVVGSGSVLMFDEDKAMVLRKVDSFYRKLDTRVELFFDTVMESQKTEAQQYNTAIYYKNNQSNSPGINALFEEQYSTLKYGVGGQFKSLHQYMVVKAKSLDDLRSFESLLFGDVENEGVMFKQAYVLDYKAAQKYFDSIYGS